MKENNTNNANSKEVLRLKNDMYGRNILCGLRRLKREYHIVRSTLNYVEKLFNGGK